MTPELYATIRRIQITTTHMVNDVMAGAYHSAFKGQGMEFEDVRAYQPGDDVRSIDWNITARFHSPYVKNFREERELTVMLVVDISGSCHFGTASRMKSEIIAEIGAVLAFSAIQNNDRVGLLLFSEEVEAYIPPKKGVRHVLRVIRDLLVFEPKGRGTDLSSALKSLGRLQKKRGICFVISDFLTNGYKTAAALTAQRHDLIAVDVSDPAEHIFPRMGLITLRDLETGEQRVIDSNRPGLQEAYQMRSEELRKERKALFHKIGAGYLHIPDGDYAPLLRQFFKKRERR